MYAAQLGQLHHPGLPLTLRVVHRVPTLVCVACGPGWLVDKNWGSSAHILQARLGCPQEQQTSPASGLGTRDPGSTTQNQQPSPMKLGSAMGREREPPGVSPVAPSSSYCSKFCMGDGMGGGDLFCRHAVMQSFARRSVTSALGGRHITTASLPPSQPNSPACPAHAPPPADTAAAAQTPSSSPAPQRRGGHAALMRRRGCEREEGDGVKQVRRATVMAEELGLFASWPPCSPHPNV